MLGGAACSQEPVKVQNTSTSDYGRDQLNRAVSEFVAAGRTPSAYAAFAKRVHELQPTMDKSVAEEAELKLTVLALAPVQALKELPVAAQAKALATTQSKTFRWVNWTGTADPRHDTWDPVTVLDVNYIETGWSLPCRSGGLMTHTARTVY